MTKVALLRMGKRVLLLFTLSVTLLPLHAQYGLVVEPVDKDSAVFSKILSIPGSFKSRLQCTDYLRKLPGLLQSKGYASASIDSLRYDSTAAFIRLFLGDTYQWATLQTDSVERRLLDAAGFHAADYSGAPLNLPRMQLLQTKLLDYLDDNGYPFAKVELDSIQLSGDRLSARLKVEKGPLYKIDSIINLGPASLSNTYLQRYLNLVNGSIYRRSVLQDVSRRLSELPFVKEAQPWSLTRLGTGSILNLYLEPRKSSQINVLVGFLPATQVSANTYDPPRTSLQFTGEATINLRNALGNGETLGLNWQQLQLRSPRLNLLFDQPYLFGSPFGASFNFDLFKKDSSFVTINTRIGTRYAVTNTQSATLFVLNQISNLNYVDTNVVIVTRRLPQEADVRSLSVGLAWDGYNTDYKFNPVRGNEWDVSIAAGTKTIRKNNVIAQLKDKNDPAFDFNRLYDTFKLKSYQFRIKAYGAHFFKLTRVSTIKAGLNLAWFQSPSIFRNELYQIGGYKLLRGFDEESIYASEYAVSTIEYRYLIGRNSNFFAFTDIGWARNNASGRNQRNSFIGAGFGMLLETKAGLFNISLAAGKRNDLDFSLRQSKIHFGYVNFF